MSNQISRVAEFRCPLPEGGMFYAAWPKAATEQDLKMAYPMLVATLDVWINYATKTAAGECEYLSWQTAAPEAA